MLVPYWATDTPHPPLTFPPGWVGYPRLQYNYTFQMVVHFVFVILK